MAISAIDVAIVIVKRDGYFLISADFMGVYWLLIMYQKIK